MGMSQTTNYPAPGNRLEGIGVLGPDPYTARMHHSVHHGKHRSGENGPGQDQTEDELSTKLERKFHTSCLIVRTIFPSMRTGRPAGCAPGDLTYRARCLPFCLPR
jgi:hypothetical protein